ncbi:MAG: hypothetical protein M1819_005554 [Sarea resinae]|nr:MAG: hypothetical protein M1819_005554 [Sarea resinae]
MEADPSDLAGVPQSFIDSMQSVEPTHDAMHTQGSIGGIESPNFCCPCGGFKGWKQIRLGGKRMSKSSSDLRFLGGNIGQGWGWETPNVVRSNPEMLENPEKKETVEQYPPSQSALERLPPEILDYIISLLGIDLPPNGYTPRNIDLMSTLLTSRTLHAATIATLYSRIIIPHSQIFSKFLEHLYRYPSLGTVVKRLDFSHFTSVGLGRTRQMNLEIQNVTAATLLKCLDLTTHLREFLVQEHIEDDLDESIIQKLFCDLPTLQAIDFCACSSNTFQQAFSSVIKLDNQTLPSPITIRRISLHECSSLSSTMLETFLPRLAYVTHLDLYHTRVTDRALVSIPERARLTHLNLGKCTHLSGEGVVEFLTTHPAVKDSLLYLNLLFDISRYRLLSSEDVEMLLPRLPSTLRSLNLNGARVTSNHIPLLLPLTKHLEELGVGYSELSMDDITALFVPAPPAKGEDISEEELNWEPSALRYLDLTGVASITIGSLFTHNSVLLSSMTEPLEVLELSERVIKGLRERAATSKQLGWVVRELGRRAWYVREFSKSGPPDNGRRAWKMGALWWGMRKIPVAWGEVGGLYGHYMFKR